MSKRKLIKKNKVKKCQDPSDTSFSTTATENASADSGFLSNDEINTIMLDSALDNYSIEGPSNSELATATKPNLKDIALSSPDIITDSKQAVPEMKVANFQGVKQQSNMSKVGNQIKGNLGKAGNFIGAAVQFGTQVNQIIDNALGKDYKVSAFTGSTAASFRDYSMNKHSSGWREMFGTNKEIKEEQKRLQNIKARLENIQTKADDYNAMAIDPTAQLQHKARQNGYFNNTPYGIMYTKNGSKLLLAKQISNKYNFNKELQKFQKGNKINKSRTLEELIEYAKKQNPRFIQRLSEKPRGIEFIDKNGKKAIGNIYLAWDYKPNSNKQLAIVYPTIQESENGFLKYYADEAFDRALENNNYLEMTPEEAEIFSIGYKKGFPSMFENVNWENNDSIIENLSKHKEGGTINKVPLSLEILELTSIIPEFQQGGEINVIPGGALHAHKHNIDIEGITKKGIPVVSQSEQGEIQQQAEIEREEIILRLELTQKLEDLYERYNNPETKQKDKDEFALEAGQLLVREILYNTQDNSGIMNKISIENNEKKINL